MSVGDMVKETAYIKQGDDVPNIGVSPQFEEGVAPLENPNDVGEKTPIQNGFAIPMLVDKKDPRDATYDEVKAQIVDVVKLEKARAHIKDRLTQLAPIFLKNKFMLGDNFSMLDVAIAPLLWRLDYYGIDLSKNAAPLLKYAERIFSRPAYIEALTPSEKVMRK